MAEIRLTALTTTLNRSSNLASYYILTDDGATAARMSLLDLYPLRNTIGSGVAVLKDITNGSLNTRSLVSANNLLAIAVNGSDEVEFTVSTANIQSLITAYNYLTSADLTSDVSGILPVPNGGTGKSTLTDKSILATQLTGTDSVREISMTTNGSIIVGGTSGPIATTLSAGANISITNSDQDIEIANTFTIPSSYLETGDAASFSSVASSGDVTISGATSGLKHTGRVDVTQLTSLSTGVTCNSTCGLIRLFDTTITADTTTEFTVTNSTVQADSLIIISPQTVSSTAADLGIHFKVGTINNGSFTVHITHTGNQAAGSVARSIHFLVINNS